jgi:hypothetical protein
VDIKGAVAANADSIRDDCADVRVPVLETLNSEYGELSATKDTAKVFLAGGDKYERQFQVKGQC